MKKDHQLSPRKRPRQERSRVTVDAILEAAAQIFEELGYAGATTNKIAARAGVSIGSLYQYYPNKDAIIFGLMERHMEEGLIHMEQFKDELQARGSMDREMLRRNIEAMIAMHDRNPQLHRVLFEEAPCQEQLWKESLKILKSISEYMEPYYRNTPGIRVKNLPMAILLKLQVIESQTHWYVIYGRDEFEQEVFIDELADMLLRYFFDDAEALSSSAIE